ncbi:MAG TPA: DM13 domain-containing protein [Dehalococcoidia bacterium]|nr:DM13 domain-containing protein [Dehalococcoidia bacterium]
MDILLTSVPLAGDLETFLSEELYPYRWPLTIAFIIGVVAALFIAYRLNAHTWAWERRLVTGPAITIFLIVFIPVSYLLISPLFDRSLICEASPIPGADAGSEDCEDENVAVAATNPPSSEATDAPAAAAATPDATDSPETDAPAFEPSVVQQGIFEGADDFHFGEGTALLIETAPGAYTLRFEDFSVRNGPDLFVVLSPSSEGYDEGSLNLGGLRGTDGAFNYDVPAGTDISQFSSAVVWCRLADVTFATATFE